MKSQNNGSLLPQEGVAKGSYTFSLREKAGMRGGNKNKALAFIISLTPTLSQRERGLLQHPPQGEGQDEGVTEIIVLAPPIPLTPTLSLRERELTGQQ